MHRSARRLVFLFVLIAFAPGLQAEEAEAPDFWQRVRTPDARPKILDERAEPTLLVRTAYVGTFKGSRSVPQPDGSTLVIESRAQDPSMFGHRQGFVLENAELGLKGRFNHLGLYYGLSVETVPREKDGNRSSDYLNDAWMGWSRTTLLDVRVGRMKVPISQANLKAAADQAFAYAPAFNFLTPKRQIGASLALQWPGEVAKLTLGAFDAVGKAEEQLKTADQLLYAARLELRLHRLFDVPAVLGPFELTLAGSFAYTKENFDPRTEHRWSGADLHLRLWRVLVEGELVLKDFYNPPQLDGSQKADRGWGWHADLLVEVLPGWLDVAGRLEEMDGDRVERGYSSTPAIDDLSRQRKRWITVGLRGHLLERVTLHLDYVHRQELEGYSLFNDVILTMAQFNL